MDQLGVRSGCASGSRHSFASPSTMIMLHLSCMAICTAQRIASASAWAGEQRWCSLPHKDMAIPKWFLATTAKADLELLIAASTLILIQPWGGGDQIRIGGSKDGWILGENTFDASRNLIRTLLMALFTLANPPWKIRWFLDFQISSMIKAMFNVIVQRCSVGMGAWGGFVINLTMSSFEDSDDESILSPHPTVVQRALAKGQRKNKCILVSSFELHKLQDVSLLNSTRKVHLIRHGIGTNPP